MGEWLMPLFPLNVVLFPRTDLPLHIFEDRYKQMITECLQHKLEFGVVLVQEQSLENTGCSAVITDVMKQYEDGRMDILVRGGRRFDILLLDHDMAYLRGAPQFFDDEAASLPGSDVRRQKAFELYSRARSMLQLEQDEDAKLQPDDEQLSFQMIARLPADLAFKQSLLLSRSEEERLTRVIPYLNRLLLQLAVAIKVRAASAGNGKGR